MAIESRSEWTDANWWAARFGCLDQRDAVLCNLGITLAHYELSLALRDVLGSDSGANFHTWAVWGSHKAGTTIRREDIPGLTSFALAAGAVLGGSLAGSARRARVASGVIVGGLMAGWLASGVLGRSAASVLGGNRIVLDDIGRATARYVTMIRTSESELARFLDTLRPGPTEQGGQALLIQAFENYDAARVATSPDVKHEHVLYANLLAILHEHLRLQAYIARAIPRPLRRLVTARLLDYQVGMDRLDVSRDVAPFVDEADPDSLTVIDRSDLSAFLVGPQGWDRSPNSLVGSAAVDWTILGDRMNYIVDLFRTRHFDESLFRPPFTPKQIERLHKHGVDCAVLDA